MCTAIRKPVENLYFVAVDSLFTSLINLIMIDKVDNNIDHTLFIKLERMPKNHLYQINVKILNSLPDMP